MLKLQENWQREIYKMLVLGVIIACLFVMIIIIYYWKNQTRHRDIKNYQTSTLISNCVRLSCTKQKVMYLHLQISMYPSVEQHESTHLVSCWQGFFPVNLDVTIQNTLHDCDKMSLGLNRTAYGGQYRDW